MKSRQTQILFLMAAAVVASSVVRLLWIEDQAAGEACRAAETALCQLRQALVLGFHYQVFGWLAVLTGIVSMGRPAYGWATAALVLSGLALVFYTTDLGAVGAVTGLIGLARCGRRQGR